MKIVAVMACPAGVAHTYMSAESLRSACEKKKIDCKVETQGLAGVENKLTREEVAGADGVILSNDVKISGMERFNGKPAVFSLTNNVIKNPGKLIEELLVKIEQAPSGTPESVFKGEADEKQKSGQRESENKGFIEKFKKWRNS